MNKWAIGFTQIPYPLILCLHHAGKQMMKRLEMFSVLLHVSVCMCVSVPVNSTLIALALQLGDFQSEENFGINKKDISKVSKCVIICAFQSEKTGRRKNYVEQADQMKLFTVESVVQH